MEVKKHRRLTLKERVQIETLLHQNKTKAYIAKTINRSRSTISREINKLGSNPKVDYGAYLAHWSAKEVYLNKRNFDKISTCKQLRIYVFKGLLLNWTPEQIAGRIKKKYPNDTMIRISHQSIYRFIYTHPKASLNKKLIKLLVRKKTRRRLPKKNVELVVK